MQQLMYETHARAEQLQLERDAVIARSREIEERLLHALSREDGLKKVEAEQKDRLERYEQALNQLNGWPLVAASGNNISNVAASLNENTSPLALASRDMSRLNIAPSLNIAPNLSPPLLGARMLNDRPLMMGGDPLGRPGMYGLAGSYVPNLGVGGPSLVMPPPSYVLPNHPPGRVISPVPQVRSVQRSWSPSKPLVV